MKWFFPALAVVFALLSMPPVGASSLDPEPTPTPEVITMETETEGGDIIVNVTVPIIPPEPAPVVTPEPIPEPLAEEGTEEDPSVMSYTVLSPDELPMEEDETALKAIVTALFGEYVPRTQTLTQYLPDGSAVTSQEVVPGVAGMDWHWMAGVGLFALVLFCLFRLLGGVLTRG